MGETIFADIKSARDSTAVAVYGGIRIETTRTRSPTNFSFTAGRPIAPKNDPEMAALGAISTGPPIRGTGQEQRNDQYPKSCQ